MTINKRNNKLDTDHYETNGKAKGVYQSIKSVSLLCFILITAPPSCQTWPCYSIRFVAHSFFIASTAATRLLQPVPPLQLHQCQWLVFVHVDALVVLRQQYSRDVIPMPIVIQVVFSKLLHNEPINREDIVRKMKYTQETSNPLKKSS